MPSTMSIAYWSLKGLALQVFSFFINFSVPANALNTPPGDYGRKIKTQRNCGEAATAVEYVV